MPTGTDPTATSPHYCRIIHLQGRDRRPAAGGQTEDMRLALVPSKMVTPSLTQGVEERHCLCSQWIYSGLLHPFVNIAGETGQTQIVRCGEPASDFRNNVVHVHAEATILLSCQAIGATLFVPFSAQVTYSKGDRHGNQPGEAPDGEKIACPRRASRR